MSGDTSSARYEFGKNWRDDPRRHFSEDRSRRATERLPALPETPKGKRVPDIGSRAPAGAGFTRLYGVRPAIADELRRRRSKSR